MPSLKILLLAALAVAAIALAVAANSSGEFNVSALAARLDALAAWTQQRPVTALTVFALLYLLAASAPFPASALTVGCGALLGFWAALLLTSLISTASCVVVFLGVKHLLGGYVSRRYHHQLSHVRAGIQRDGAYYLFMLRMVPLFPFFSLNWLMAMTPIRTAPFALASQIGMLPATAVYVNAGAEINRIHDAGDIMSWRVALAFALIGLLPLLSRLAQRGWQRRTQRS